MAKKLEEEFLSSPIQSKPIGFYAENEILQRIFRQDRFYQNAMEIGTAIEIAKVLKNRPDLHKQYKIILSAYSDLTNPLSSFSVDDIVVYADYFDEPAVLERKLLESEKWLGLKQRGAGRIPGQELVRLLPYSTSKENELFAKIYNYSDELPRHNVMNRLIEAIRSGEIDLTPTEKSGWYVLTISVKHDGSSVWQGSFSAEIGSKVTVVSSGGGASDPWSLLALAAVLALRRSRSNRIRVSERSIA